MSCNFSGKVGIKFSFIVASIKTQIKIYNFFKYLANVLICVM